MRRRLLIGIAAGYAIREELGAILHNGVRFMLRTAAHVHKVYLGPHGGLSNRVYEIAPRFHGLTIHAGDHIPWLNPRFGRRAARLHILQYHAVGCAEFPKHDGIAALLLGKRHPDRTASHLAVLYQLVVNRNGHIGRQSEAYPFVASSARHDGGINTNDAATHIHQRPTRIARVDGRISLKKALELPPNVPAVSGA